MILLTIDHSPLRKKSKEKKSSPLGELEEAL
jgi:hypothetical protein